MELVFKLPPGKPAFIGILFEATDPRASTMNQDVIDELMDAEFSGELVLTESLAIFKLKCSKPRIIKRYEFLSYKGEHLKHFLRAVSPFNPLNFGHVIDEYDRHVLAKTARGFKNFTRKLTGLKVVVEDPLHELDI